jgi:membrane-associated phospholipid phosphatase
VFAAFFLDRDLAQFLHRFEESPLVRLADAVPDLGKCAPVFFIALVLAAALWAAAGDRERFAKTTFVLGVGAFAASSAEVLKLLFGRVRPSELFNGGLYGFDFFGSTTGFDSFPSSHAAVAAGLAGSLAILSPPYRGTFFAVAAAIGFLKVVTGEHYFSDTLFGFAIGLAAVGCLSVGFERFGIRLKPSAPGDGRRSGQ